jgi:vitamin B12 transporter
MKKSMVTLACLSLAALAGAQQADTLTRLHDSLKTVTVTATRTVKDIMDVGRSVTVISNDQIKQASCNTVAELLSQQEGIFIVGTGQNPGAIQSLFMRGADNNNTTIMIDGVPITDPSTDHGEIDLSELSLAAVDRIEIVRGSHSTLYGSSSIGGVINIITKKNYAPGFHIGASVTGGEFGPGTSEFDGNILLNYSFKNGLYATAGFHYVTDQGLNATIDTISHPLSFQQNPDRDNYNKQEPFAKIGYAGKKLDIYAEYRGTSQNSDGDAGAYTDLKGATDHFTRNFVTGAISYKPCDHLQLQYLSSYSYDRRNYIQAPDTIDAYGDVSSVNDTYTGTSVTNEVKAEYDYKTSQFIVGGGYSMAQMTLDEYSTFTGFPPTENKPDSIRFQQGIVDAYAQADVNGGSFNSKLAPYSLLVGGRYSSNSQFGTNFSYELNPYVKINANSTLFFSYSTGFDAPSLYQTFAPSNFGYNPTISVTLGNPKLTPETSKSIEIGVKHRISDNIFITFSWFRTEVDNYIDYVNLWTKNKDIDSLSYTDNLGSTYLNVGQQINQGFEVSASVKLSPKVEISGNVSLMSGTLKYSQNTIDTSQTHGAQVQINNGGAFLYGDKVQTNGLLRRPGSLGNFTLSYHPIKKLCLTARARYVGTRFDAQYDYNLGPDGAIAFANVGDYTLVDLLAYYDITKNLSVTLRCENLFNTSYEEILGYTTRGRSYYINIRFSL